jgi:acyl-CoA synthetase (AMP-forming)/AMP-acid ligase II
MAEATVLISAGRRGSGPQIGSVSRSGLQHHMAGPATEAGDAQDVVGSGQALAGSRIAIVDPESRQRLPAGQVGEIWAAGPHIARGYWCNPAASDAAFRARITGEDENIWLRTGDLGFMDAAGELFVTGRIKEILIIRGANHYPQDIEHTMQSCHPALRAHGGAAFTVADPQAAEKLVVVQEIARTYRKDIVPDEIVARIREAIVNEHEIVPHAIALLRPGALPQTTSGKIQRSLSRQLWLAGSLDRL